MIIEIREPDFIHKDERGKLTQLARAGFSQINVVESASGAFRGGHYHKLNAETFFVVSGMFELAAEKGGVNESYIFKAGDMFTVPPYVTHSFNFTEDTVLVALYDKGVENDDGTKDIYAAQ